jgi:CheY-like chemotaxis protein
LVELRPDGCIHNLTMPRMDGFELATRIRALEGRQPLLVALTALGDYKTLDREVASGFDLHFTKPVELIWELREHVKRMVCPV